MYHRPELLFCFTVGEQPKQEITVIWARQLVSPKKLGPVP